MEIEKKFDIQPMVNILCNIPLRVLSSMRVWRALGLNYTQRGERDVPDSASVIFQFTSQF